MKPPGYYTILALIVLGLTGCTAADQAKVAQLCAYDAALQPIAGAVVTTVAPGAAPAVTIDNTLIHPAIVAACGTVTKPK